MLDGSGVLSAVVSVFEATRTTGGFAGDWARAPYTATPAAIVVATATIRKRAVDFIGSYLRLASRALLHPSSARCKSGSGSRYRAPTHHSLAAFFSCQRGSALSHRAQQAR